jgi:DNA-binding MarR family transcriptional regulator
MKDAFRLPIGETGRLLSLLSAAGAIEDQLESALGEVGLSIAKMGLIANLVDIDEAISLSRLADRCACVRSNITQLVDRLESDGLVQREADPDDRRSIRATLTPAGRERYEAGRAVLEDRVGAMVARIGGKIPNSIIEQMERLAGRACS